MAASALLSLADWLGHRDQPEEELCFANLMDQSPRALTTPDPLSSEPIWRTLNPDQRQILVHALERLLARRLPATPDAKEVLDERN